MHIRYITLSPKRSIQRQRSILYNDQGTISQDDIIVNIYAPNTGVPSYRKYLLTALKQHIDKNTNIIGDLNTPLTWRDRSYRQKINKDLKWSVRTDVLSGYL